MKKLYEGNIRKNFIVFSIPLIITALFSQMYSIINTIMAGKLIGDVAISAIGSTAPLISFISSIFWGYGTGFAVYVSVLFGKSDYKKMANVIKINMLLSSAFTVLISVLCIVFHNGIFDFLNIEEAIRDKAFAYFSVYISGLVLLNLNWCGVYISNAVGRTKNPLIASIISNVLNISLNYLFLKVFGMGVEGTALSTIISSLCVGTFYIAMVCNIFKELKVKIRGLYLDIREIRMSLSYAIPNMLQQSIMYLCTFLVSPFTNLCGAEAIAGYTIGMRIYDLVANVYQNSTKVVATYTAQCVGAKKYNVIVKGIKSGMLQTSLFLIAVLVPMVLFADEIANIFLDKSEGIHYAGVFLRFCLPLVIFNVINNMAHAIFRGAGAGKYLVVSSFIYAVSRVAYSYIFFDRFELYGIYLAIVLSWVTEAIFGVIVYVSGKWKSEEYLMYENYEGER